MGVDTSKPQGQWLQTWGFDEVLRQYQGLTSTEIE